jgi:hypothetical protein
MSMEDLSNSSDNRMRMRKAMDSLTNELDYFVYLAEKGEIKDSIVLEYYRKRLIPIFGTNIYIQKIF